MGRSHFWDPTLKIPLKTRAGTWVWTRIHRNQIIWLTPKARALDSGLLTLIDKMTALWVPEGRATGKTVMVPSAPGSVYSFWLQPIVWKTSHIVTWYTDLCTWTCVFIYIKWKQEFTPPKLLCNKHGTLIFPILFSFTFFQKADDNFQNCYHDPIQAFDPKHCFGLIWMSAPGDSCLASEIPGPSPPIHPPDWQ